MIPRATLPINARAPIKRASNTKINQIFLSLNCCHRRRVLFWKIRGWTAIRPQTPIHTRPSVDSHHKPTSRSPPRAAKNANNIGFDHVKNKHSLFVYKKRRHTLVPPSGQLLITIIFWLKYILSLPPRESSFSCNCRFATRKIVQCANGGFLILGFPCVAKL